MRYDALVGLVNAKEAGIDVQDAETDRDAHPELVDRMTIVAEDQLEFMCEHTPISKGKVATYLYYVLIEEMAAGLLLSETGADVPFEQLAEDAREEYRGVMALVCH